MIGVLRLEELGREWPEIYRVAEKLRQGADLSNDDREWLDDISRVSGWDEDDVAEDLKNLDRDPSERAVRYRMLFEKYLEEAKRRKEAGDTEQAGEKLWGAITALIKLYAAKKGIPIVHWSRSKIEKFVSNNVEQDLKEPLLELLDKGSALHEHFYEKHMTFQSFEYRWSRAMELLDGIKRRVLEEW